MEKSEGVVHGGMVLVPADSTAVEGDDDVNVIRHHVLLITELSSELASLGVSCLVVQHRVSRHLKNVNICCHQSYPTG